MASCDNTVLTGQEGLIQFKPLGTTNCVDDYCPFMGTRIYLPCSADYDVNDCLEVETVKIPSGKGQADDWRHHVGCRWRHLLCRHRRQRCSR